MLNKPADGFRELPNLTCNHCNTVMSYGAPVMNQKQKIQKGDLYICSNCGTVNQMGDSMLQKMTRAEIEKLDKQTQLVLATTVAAIVQQQDTKNEIVSVNGIK
jgi:hypothetical protein